jgi:hypothetical protein
VPIMESRNSSGLVKAFDRLVELIEPADDHAGGDTGGARRLFKRKA